MKKKFIEQIDKYFTPKVIMEPVTELSYLSVEFASVDFYTFNKVGSNFTYRFFLFFRMNFLPCLVSLSYCKLFYVKVPQSIVNFYRSNLISLKEDLRFQKELNQLFINQIHYN